MQKIKDYEYIQLKNNISFEQYQMAIRVLEAMGVKEKEPELTDNQKEMILKGIKQAKNGQTKSHLEVRQKAKEIRKK